MRLAAQVAELETGVRIPGVLEVHEPQLFGARHDVRRQQVVMTRNGAFGPHGHRAANLGDVPGVVEVGRWQSEPSRYDEVEIALLEREHVEVAGKSRARVQPSAGGRYSRERVAVVEVGTFEGTALDPFDDKCAHVGQVGKDSRRNAGRGRRHGVHMLGITVDRQQS